MDNVFISKVGYLKTRLSNILTTNNIEASPYESLSSLIDKTINVDDTIVCPVKIQDGYLYIGDESTGIAINNSDGAVCKTSSVWTAQNMVLKSGEIGYETDTRKIKIGDGHTAWNSLQYFYDPSEVTNLTNDLTNLSNTLSSLNDLINGNGG